jgi:hypothetical protein
LSGSDRPFAIYRYRSPSIARNWKRSIGIVRHLSKDLLIHRKDLSPSIVVDRDLHGYLSKSIMMPPKAHGSFNYNRPLQPIIKAPAGQIIFWCGMIVPTAQQMAESYLRLGKSSASGVFPIRFESAVPLLETQVRGEIPGFLILEDFSTMRTRVVT